MSNIAPDPPPVAVGTPHMASQAAGEDDASPAPAVADDAARHRLVVTTAGGDEAELFYEREVDRLHLLHTGVPAAFRGQGTGRHLVAAALAIARRDDLTVVPWCPFVSRWLRTHPDVADGVTVDWSMPLPDPQRGHR